LPASARSSGERGSRQLYNAPGLPPNGDPRTPDILVTPHIGVTYSGSTKKLAEHGGFAHDDTNVMLLVSNPGIRARTETIPVTTMQVAPSILKALGLNPSALQSVQQEGTETLPKLF
jgi:arylsulfatase A-like enzyme